MGIRRARRETVRVRASAPGRPSQWLRGVQQLPRVHDALHAGATRRTPRAARDADRDLACAPTVPLPDRAGRRRSRRHGRWAREHSRLSRLPPRLPRQPCAPIVGRRPAVSDERAGQPEHTHGSAPRPDRDPLDVGGHIALTAGSFRRHRTPVAVRAPPAVTGAAAERYCCRVITASPITSYV